ncbi:MAG: hypothetical protein HYU52_03615 [Acidobacteria bacterium]|nr:hypothetical protein [Acidobacteriota bacterium]
MHPEYRAAFNAAFDDGVYARYQAQLEARLGCSFEFRLVETPVFFTDDIVAKLTDAARAVVEQISDTAKIAEMKKAIPAKWDTPGMDSLPSFTQVDFAICRDADGALEPKLIELQGFPSLSALEIFQRDAWSELLAEMPGLAREWACWFTPDRASYLELARRTIVGSHDPKEVVLLDLDPPKQKTYPDFAATRLLFGADPVCPSDLEREGNRLYRRDENGKRIRVRRIYNRVVFDELMKSGMTLPFDFRDPLEVEWAPHPNWYWTWSKYSIPFIDHPAAPKATFVSELESIPDDLSRYVLKPLFSFAGGGVNVEPTRADIEAIPERDRHDWCIMEKIDYAPVLTAVDGGGVKVEVRMMFFRPDDEARPILAQNLCRTSRGKMLGVDFNKNYTWVGGTVGLA